MRRPFRRPHRSARPGQDLSGGRKQPQNPRGFCPVGPRERQVPAAWAGENDAQNSGDFGRKQGFKFKLIGIDANEDAVAYAQELSNDYAALSFQKLDIFSEEFKDLKYDIALSTLFLHHFKENEIEHMLKQLASNANIGIVINDLHRSTLAYGLFKLLGLFISNDMIVQDGLTSILRSFKRNELESHSDQLQLKSQIHWKWAFRYQWLIRT